VEAAGVDEVGALAAALQREVAELERLAGDQELKERGLGWGDHSFELRAASFESAFESAAMYGWVIIASSFELRYRSDA
jgi:hypothetical protein